MTQKSLGVSLLICVLACLPASSQSPTTSLRGVVRDPRGAVVPNANVALRDFQTGYSRSTVTDNTGTYQFLELPPSTYTASVSSPGFAVVTQSSITLLVSTANTLNFALRVESETTNIEVKSDTPLVNTQDATLGNPFNETQIETLPSEGRNPVAILTLQPGVSFIGNNDTINPNFDSRNGAVNGARSDQTNITIDGIDDNDQLKGYAFQGALRATLDSLQEFRVTTSNANAEAGRSSGAQVTLVTKSGTNHLHGSLYEFNRTTFTTANDWFNKQSEIRQGLPNVPGSLIRNTFGASLGGPVKRNRLFFFGTYEGQRTRENTQVTRTVPSADLRAGIIHYLTCPTAPTCTPGDPNNSLVNLTPPQIATMDPSCSGLGTCPQGPGVDPSILQVLQRYPLPNTDSVGDGFNIRGFTFSAPAPAKLDTYIVKLDYNLNQNANHKIFIRGNLQNDKIAGSNADGPQFPGDPPNHVFRNNSKGIAAGYTAVLGASIINDFRYGYVRQGVATSGLSNQHHVSFGYGVLDDPQGFSRITNTKVPVHSFMDTLALTHGKHTFQLGGSLRIIDDLGASTESSFLDGRLDVSYFATAGMANKNTSLDPARFGFPPVATFFQSSYDNPMDILAGLITTVVANYNRTKTGALLPEGTPVARHFRAHEGEVYVQDSWRATPALMLTVGVRYTLLQPPYETNGAQVAPSTSLNEFFDKRAEAMLSGNTYNPAVSYDLSGQANGRTPIWAWDYKDIAPRVAFAWSPAVENGWIRRLLGAAGRTSIRGGYGIYYDHFGEGVVSTFARQGSFGLSTRAVTPVGTTTVDTAPRFTSLFDIPSSSPAGPQLQVPPPVGGFPTTPPTTFAAGGFGITWGLDDKLKTPYSHVVNFTVTRELPGQLAIQASYVGRFGRRLLQEEDLAMPLDIVDPKSKIDYFSAAKQLSKLAQARTPIQNVGALPYWEDLFPTAAGAGKLSGCAPGPAPSSPTATQNMYDNYFCNLHNETGALFNADLFCFPGCATLNGITQPYQFFDGEWASLFGWRSIGTSTYHAAQMTLRRRMHRGLQFDLNYTLSKSLDLGSNAERISSFEGFGFDGQIVNAWFPKQLRGVSDFDTTHQLNSNWIYQLPIGRNKHFGSGMGTVGNALLGDWQMSGLLRWTSGLPYSINNGAIFPTNWSLTGLAMLSGSGVPHGGTFIDAQGNPTIFRDRAAALSDFRFDYPGESGQRNIVRGAGFLGIDAGLSKSWKCFESQALEFRWEVFNVTNSVRFGFLANGAETSLPEIDVPQTFGNYNQTLTKPRIMQFALRYSF